MRDMLGAAAQISVYTQGMGAVEFVSNALVVDAVVYRLLVIGEAAGAVPARIRERHAHVPWQAVRGMRNRLVHEYFGVRTETVWATVQHDLPVLVAVLEELLRVEPEE
ncbi:MAG: DUF86 domain-containing protein [Alphaproteobacteria bacterium]|nr:DUF86 domain-containing protein [Alphaproteobacteria bacterium]